jgi:non-ribosomal peptide synthetase-like protein
VLLHQYFDRAVGRWPDAVAIDVPPAPGRARQEITYRALDSMARAVAARLGPLDAPEPIVAILIPRDSPWLLAAQLAALYRGAAFTSLEPAFPDGQLRAQLDDALPAALVVTAATAARAEAMARGRCAIVVAGAGLTDGPSTAAPRAPATRGDRSLAYVIYTSGTSGRPKGVLVEHRSIANLVQADLDEFGLGLGDRVVQGSSAAYDSSIEETWLALAAGGTVVVADDATVRLGPDLVAWLHRERITVFCPPPTLLRSTGCEDPARALPHLRLLYVGGEALPEDVAERWGRGRTLVNGYGPTEAAVTVVRETVPPGMPIAIGRAIAGVTASVLAVDGTEVPPETSGELCLSGAALARGYHRLPALTAERFPTHPTMGRIYRTGDRARRDRAGRIFYEGRLDAQVKLRGYRVELEAVEARLAAWPGVALAAAAVQGDGAAQRLVAFVVPARPEAPPSLTALLAALRDTLPHYMVPARLGLVDALPTSVGGKLDRASLPGMDRGTDQRSSTPRVGANSPLEAAIVDAMQSTLHLANRVSTTDDFFIDLGGDSLAAGLLVSRLRARTETASLTTRDVYQGRTAAALAARAAATNRPGPAPAATVETLAPLGRVLATTAVQSVWIAGELVIAALLGYAVIAIAVPWLDARVGLFGVIVAAPIAATVAAIAWTPIAVLLTAAAARALTAGLRPGRVPAWSVTHLRLWIVQQLAAGIPWGALSGTHALSATLRLLGARVGHHVAVHRGVDLAHGVWHLLALGDRVSLARDVALRLVDYDAGSVVIGAVTVGDDATLDVHAGVGPDCVIEANASLGPWASVRAGTRVAAGERWEGVPATAVGRTAPAPPLDAPGALGAWSHTAAMGAARGAAAAAFWVPALVAAVAVCVWCDVATLADLRAQLWTARFWLPASAGVVASLAIGLVVAAAICRGLGPERPGVVAARSWTSVRVECKTQLLDGASRWLSGSTAWPLWLRVAGMRIGPAAEVSTIIDTVPDLVTMGQECFLADGVYLAAPRIDRGTMTLGRVTMGARCFVGNHAVLGAGTSLPDDMLIGVCTVATPAMAAVAGAAWFGHPPLLLPRPVPIADRRTTHDPSALRRLNRALWEAARLALPIGPLAATAWWAERLLDTPARGLALVGVAAATTAAAALALAAVCVALKWLLLGRVRPGVHPLWSCWCSRWDFLYVIWDLYARWLVVPFDGTLWLPWYLRAMGMRIGKRVLLGPGFTQVVDPDLIAIGDGATVHAMFQAHTFEDRVLKLGPVRIGAGATLGPGTVPLYDVTVGAGTAVAAHSVIMKGETLVAQTAYEGVPVAVASQM